ncbi:hypothetical protein [Micromonospora sp. CA-244673]|uniref:hypothetical protein n=1 Tax=Micromonospora sp. CA-244673 TaxID=3239958 RepID=UPI003D8C630F
MDEATSLIDPTTARRTERSLVAQLQGRTVIAIAHYLHTARAAYRVAVVEGRRVTELGAYAALWRSRHGTDRPSDRSAALTRKVRTP